MSDPFDKFIDHEALKQDEFHDMIDHNAMLTSGTGTGNQSVNTKDDKYNPLETAVARLAHGGSFGLDSELSGAVSGLGRVAGVNNLGGNIGEQSLTSPTIDPQQILNAYKDTRDSVRKKQEEISKESPKVSKIYDLLGALISAKALPSISSPIGEASQEAPLIQKIATNTVNSLPISAALSAGQSNADLTNGEIGKFAKDVGIGTTIGAGIGAAVPLATTGLSELGSGIKNNQLIQDLLTSYKEGKSGNNLRDPEFLKNSRNQLKQLFGQADDQIRTQDSNILNQRANIIKDLNQDPSKVVDVSKQISQLKDEVTTNPFIPLEQKQQLQQFISNQEKMGNTRNPEQLDQLIKIVKGDVNSTLNSPSGRPVVNQLKGDLTDLQNNLDPRLSELNKTAGQITDIGETLTKRNPLDYNAAKAENNMKESGANLLENANNDYKSQNFLDEVLNGGLQTSKADIPSLKTLVPEAANTLEQATPIANNLRIAKQMQSPTLTGSNILSQIGNAVVKSGTQSVNYIGESVKANGDAIYSGVSQISKYSPEALNNLGNYLLTQPSTVVKNFGNTILDASTKEGPAKDAIIFGLMQQPVFRKLLSGNDKK